MLTLWNELVYTTLLGRKIKLHWVNEGYYNIVVENTDCSKSFIKIGDDPCDAICRLTEAFGIENAKDFEKHKQMNKDVMIAVSMFKRAS